MHKKITMILIVLNTVAAGLNCLISGSNASIIACLNAFFVGILLRQLSDILEKEKDKELYEIAAKNVLEEFKNN